MKKLKMILPMLAFVLAIGVSFAFVNTTPEDFYATGYIQVDSIWYPVNVDCQRTENFNCLAQIEGEAELYDVHNSASETAPILKSASSEPKMINDPR